MAPYKVLLAEDDADDRQIFYDFLRHRTDIILLPIVENGEELLNVLNTITNQDQLPGFIILDQNMPKLNGLQTLRILKADERFSLIPVMFYTTYIDPQLIKDAIDMGAAQVSPKPVTKEGYNQMMDEFVAKLIHHPI